MALVALVASVVVVVAACAFVVVVNAITVIVAVLVVAVAVNVLLEASVDVVVVLTAVVVEAVVEAVIVRDKKLPTANFEFHRVNVFFQLRGKVEISFDLIQKTYHYHPPYHLFFCWWKSKDWVKSDLTFQRNHNLTREKTNIKLVRHALKCEH